MTIGRREYDGSQRQRPARARHASGRFSSAIVPYLYLLPVLLGVVIVTGGAIVVTVGLGFTEWDFLTAPRFVGLDNYREMVASDLFWTVAINTFYYVALAVPPMIGISLALALLVHRRIRGVRLFRTLLFFPVVTSMVAVAVVWSWLYNPEHGLINFVLNTFFGIDGPRWLQSTEWALPAIAMMTVWKGVGYNMLIFLAGLQGIPAPLYEAASLDGAGRVRQFLSITLPALSPTTFFVLIITLIGSFQLFEQTYMMTEGGPANSTLTLSYFVFQNAFQYFRMGYATALACLLFAITFAVTLVQFRLQRRWVHYE